MDSDIKSIPIANDINPPGINLPYKKLLINITTPNKQNINPNPNISLFLILITNSISEYKLTEIRIPAANPDC